VEYAPPYNIKDLLYRIIEREISVSRVVADRSLSSSTEAAEIIKLLSSAAAEMNLIKVVVDLGQAQAMGSYPDPLENVPEVSPVIRTKVSIL
jgi:DNA-directed RNA polymerase